MAAKNVFFAVRASSVADAQVKKCLKILDLHGKMVGAGRFELAQAKITEALKTRDNQWHQWSKAFLEFSS